MAAAVNICSMLFLNLTLGLPLNIPETAFLNSQSNSLKKKLN
jgi:hypothetical protein